MHLNNVIKILSLFLFLLLSSFIIAQSNTNTNYVARTSINPEITVEELKVMLLPLVKDELFMEADAWLLLLRKTSQKIATDKLELIAEKNKLSQLDSANFDNKEKSSTSKIKNKKDGTINSLNGAREEIRFMVERLNLVLTAINDKIGLDEKGNELEAVMPYRRYINTVSGLKIDVRDTESTWRNIKGYLFSLERGIKWAINAVIFILIIFLFWLLSMVLQKAVRKVTSFSASNSKILNDFFINSVSRLTFIIGILVALSAIGINIAPLMALIGATGFVVAFALQGTLSNFASGIMIMLYRPFDVRDHIEVAGVKGKIKSMTLVSTTILSPDNKLIIIPNNSIWGDVIINADYSRERRVDLVFGIGYDDDIEKSIQIMEKVLAEHPLVLDMPESVVKVTELADSSVNFICRPWTKTKNYWAVYWEITRAVKEAFDAAGISIPFPQTDIHLHK